MSNEVITVTGAWKLVGLPDTACFTSFKDLLLALQAFSVLEIPKTITNVVVSNVQPLDSQRNYVWFRTGSSGHFIGIYVYSDGKWVQVFRAPQEIIRIGGIGADSRTPPPGYQLIDSDNAGFTSAQVSFIQSGWHKDPTNTFWDVFDVTWATV